MIGIIRFSLNVPAAIIIVSLELQTEMALSIVGRIDGTKNVVA